MAFAAAPGASRASANINVMDSLMLSSQRVQQRMFVARHGRFLLIGKYDFRGCKSNCLAHGPGGNLSGDSRVYAHPQREGLRCAGM
jgi:hypothetical protein